MILRMKSQTRESFASWKHCSAHFPQCRFDLVLEAATSEPSRSLLRSHDKQAAQYQRGRASKLPWLSVMKSEWVLSIFSNNKHFGDAGQFVWHNRN